MSLVVRAIAALLALFTVSAHRAEAEDEAGWSKLFNGHDLQGWETCLGVPVEESEPIGADRDPAGVFRVVEEEGQPAIRISGQIVGGLATRASFENYHLQLDFKWGVERHAPRAELPRDSGLLYHGVNGFNAATGWLESAEFGILEGGETGDFYSVPGQHGVRVLVDLVGEDIPPQKRRYPEQSILFRFDGKPYIASTEGVLNGDDNEKPRGQWNRLDLLCLGQTSLHVVNGTVNLMLTNIRRRIDGREVPLAGGRIQLQSEGAEVFYRNLRIRPIDKIPDDFLRQTHRTGAHNTLSEAQREAGWLLLFDGRTLEGWRGYRKTEAPKGWQAQQGALTRVADAGDLITQKTFGDFELALDWKISHGGNSGIFYRLTEEGQAAYETGPEYEIRDNAFWLDDPYTAGANYGLHPPAGNAARPVGYWNQARIVVRGNQVEHWLNGRRIVDYELESPEWRQLLKASKYHQGPGYARSPRGHIGLQDHGAQVWYRNIKLRPLEEP